MRRAAAILLGALILARAAGAREIIQSFHSSIEIETNAEIRVTETIQVHAEGQSIKRGIYRDFPNLYRDKWGLRQSTGFAVQRVLRDDRPEPWHGEQRENGQRVYIGNANVFLREGDYTYELTYTTDRQLGFFEDHDELYWNVTGNGWDFPILQATADVMLPPGVEVTAREAYTGPFGAKGRNYVTDSPAPNVARFATTRSLNVQEGLTVVVGWPKGAIVPAVRPGDLAVRIRDNPGLALGVVGIFLVFIYYVAVWSLFGRDPRKGTIIPLYSPPEGFSPAAVRVMTRMKFDAKAFAANLIELAVKGALVLTESNKEYSVQRGQKKPGDLPPDERLLLESLFRRGDTLVFKQESYARVYGARDALRGNVMAKLEKNYFVKNMGYWFAGLLFSLAPLAISLIDAKDLGGTFFMSLWLSLWSLGVTGLISAAVTQFRSRSYAGGIFLALFSIPFMVGEFVGLRMLEQSTSLWVAGLFAVGVVMNGIFYHLLKAPTRLGRSALDRIEGFKRYLTVAEKDRLNFENPPARTPQLFDKFLPYALALDVEQQWAEQFSDILANASAAERGGYSPAWYRGTPWSTGNLSTFATSIGTSLPSAISASSRAPGSSSGFSSGGGGGFSGGGGGGSSGGGGGGGGGGGW